MQWSTVLAFCFCWSFSPAFCQTIAGRTTDNSQYRVILATNQKAAFTPLSPDFGGSSASGAIGGLGGLLTQNSGGGLSLFSSDFTSNSSSNSTNATAAAPVATLNRTFAGAQTGVQVFNVNTTAGINATNLCDALQNATNGLNFCEPDSQVHTDVHTDISKARHYTDTVQQRKALQYPASQIVISCCRGAEKELIAELAAGRKLLQTSASSTGANATSPTPNDALYAQQWNMQRVDVVPTWQAGFTGTQSVRVCMIDTGTDLTHPDIMSNLWVNEAELNGKAGVDDDNNGVIDDIYGASFVNGAVSGNPQDQNGHGTFVAGVVGAVGNNKIGVTGVSQRVEIVTCQFMDATGNGWVSDAVQCIDYCITEDAHVMSNSWGGVAPSDALTQAIASAQTHGTLFVASAGNDGDNTDDVQHLPSTISSPVIVAVGATDSYDNFWPQSNYGTKTVQMAAPGVSVLSLGLGGLYVKLSGTSMATPHISGCAALLLQKFIANGWSITTTNNGGLGTQLKTIIQQAANPVPGNKVANGRLDINQALQLVPLSTSSSSSSASSFGSGAAVESFGAAEIVPEPTTEPQEPASSNRAQIESNVTSSPEVAPQAPARYTVGSSLNNTIQGTWAPGYAISLLNIAPVPAPAASLPEAMGSDAAPMAASAMLAAKQG